MQLSTFQEILIALQDDLNAMTLKCALVNSALAEVIEACDISVVDLPQTASKFAKALSSLLDTMESFSYDSERLEKYLDAKG